MSADAAEPVKLGAERRLERVFPMGEPIAETLTPARSAASRKAPTCRR